MKVKKISLSKTDSDEDVSNDFESSGFEIDLNEIIEKDAMCRICLSNEISKYNVLISPCECSGSIKYIHVDCLKTWLYNKIQTKTTESSTSYY